MSYCTPEDVDNLMGIVAFTNATIPDYQETQGFITGRAALLDGAAQAAGYTVPVTATQAKALMKEMNIYGAACAAWHAGQVSESLLPPRVEYWCSQYDDFIKALKEGTVQLPGETPQSANDGYFLIRPQIPRDGFLTQQELLE